MTIEQDVRISRPLTLVGMIVEAFHCWIGKESQLVEMACVMEHPDEPDCGHEHWHWTGFERQTLNIGASFTIPLTRWETATKR